MKKRVISGIFAIVLSLSLTVPTFATSMQQDETQTISAKGKILISDPCTGETWDWELETSDISVENISGIARTGMAHGQTGNAEVNIDIAQYLSKTMTRPIDTETVSHDDVTITVGLRYSADEANNTVSIYRAYGSTPDNGMFYATNKKFYYSNPSVFDPIKKTPTGTSWSYSTDSTAGFYYADVAPYALLDCRITVRGMESSGRDVSVICELTFA